MTDDIVAYSDLRRALVAPDALSLAELVRLQMRVERAAKRYPSMAQTPAINAENAVLQAYHTYLEAVLNEHQGIDLAHA